MERSHRKQWNRDHPHQPLPVEYESYWKRDFSNQPDYHLATIAVLVADHGYTLVKEIAQGGMGRVLLVQNSNVNGRLEALKVVLLKNVASEWDEQRRHMFRERFERDFSALSHSDLVHEPNLAHLYNNATIDGLRYFTMVYVEGQTLFKHVETRGAWAEDVVVARMAPLARLVHKLHNGPKLIHRDLHPGNFIWSERNGRVFLIDFGLARSLEGSDLTESGVGMGLRGFWAPEQAKNAKSADHRSDVYSFAATLYFLLTGQKPHKAGQPDTFPIDSPRLLNPTISASMEGLCLRGLEEKPENRYQSMEELADELERCATVAPQVRRPASIAVAESKPTRRRWLIGVTGVATAAVVGTGVYCFSSRCGPTGDRSERQDIQPTPNRSAE
jgi:serine/threonine-protein kinase